jgi:signal transduction histidine kinase
MLSAEPLRLRRPYAVPMVGNSLRALWYEPRPERPPARVWRDWALLALVLSGTALEAVLQEDRTWLAVRITLTVVVALTLLWRRTHPLAAVAVAFGTFLAFDVARMVVAIDATGMLSVGAILVLPYALFRWGAGREATIGLGIILVWLPITHVAEQAGAADVVAGTGFFLFSAALGASIRFHANTRLRDIEEAKLRLRNELARELHDTVGHHVSAIAIQAQAGRAMAAVDPERALTVLETIEEAASRTLEDMRAMVGVLRDGTEPDLAPQPGIDDVERLARDVGGWPRVAVHLSGDLADLSPPVGVALYRIAQEAVTNATRHARNATCVTVEVDGDADRVHLSVRDDGDLLTTHAPGFGLLGMTERTSLLGGTIHAGPAREGGWTVEATLPKARPTTSPSRPA